MKTIRQLLKLRRSDDYVKIFLIIVLAAIYFTGNAIYGAVQFYNMLNQPREYVFSGGTWNAETEQKLTTIRGLENITDITPQLSYTLVLKNGNHTTSVPCYAVSAEYMKNVYGIEYRNEEVYLTENAYSQVIRETGISQKSSSGNSQLEYSLDAANTGYSSEAGQNGATYSESGICKIKVLGQANHKEDTKKNLKSNGDTQFALIVRGLNKLKQESTQLRVCVAKQDIDGMTIKSVENNQFIMEKNEGYLTDEANRKIAFLKIRYNLIIGILCTIFAVILWKKIAGRE